MPPRRNLTARDMPALLMFIGGILGAGAVGIPLAEQLDLANEGDLVTVSGQVNRIYVTNRPKAGRMLQIALRSSDRVHNLTQADMSAVIPAIGSIKPDDVIDARVGHDMLGRDLEWIWVLNRGGKTIVTYQDTENFLQALHARTRWHTYASGISSICLIVAGVALRRRFGAWRDAT
jgi:hypothetical protein